MSCYCVKEIIACRGGIRDAMMCVCDTKPQGNYCYQCHTYQSTHISVASSLLSEEEIRKVLDKCPRLTNLDLRGSRATKARLQYILESDTIGTRHYSGDGEHVVTGLDYPHEQFRSCTINCDIKHHGEVCRGKRIISY